MEKKPNIHIVIYSEIFEYDGGRETWLSYFLPNLYERGIFDNIYVYHIKPRTNKDNLKTKFKSIVNFNETDIGIPNEHNSFRNAYLYTRNTYYQLNRNIASNDIILVIGTRMELLPSILLKIKFKEQIVLVPWIRSITVGETISQRNYVFGQIVKILESICFILADYAICNGTDTFEYYSNTYKRLNGKLAIIENAVNIEDYKFCNEEVCASKPLKIAYIGRFASAKGFEQLINAVNIYYDQIQEEKAESIEFHVWGHGNLESIIPEYIINHGVLARKDVPLALRDCDCVVLLNKSTNNEAAGVSHSLLEAMAAGKIIIAWDNKVHNRIINNDSAFLIEEGNISELANLFIKLANEEIPAKILVSKGIKAREKVMDFDISNHISKFENLVEKGLKYNPVPDN